MPDRRLNGLLTPRRLLAQEASRLPKELGAPRSALRPAWAYLWLPGAQAFQRFVPRNPLSHARAAELPTLARAIRRHLQPVPLDVLALGAGDGGHEVRLVQHLREQRTLPLSLCLQDLSELLLSSAYFRAAESLASRSQTELWALLSDLEELSTHADLLVVPGRQRLVLLLGGTLGELTDDLRVLRFGLARCEPGDLLVLDVPLAVKGSEEEIWAQQGESVQQVFTAPGTSCAAACFWRPLRLCLYSPRSMSTRPSCTKRTRTDWCCRAPVSRCWSST